MAKDIGVDFTELVAAQGGGGGLTVTDAPPFVAFIGGVLRLFPSPGAAHSLLPLTETWTVGDAVGTLNGDFGWVDFIGTHGWDIDAESALLTDAGSIAHGGRLNADLGTDDYQVTVVLSAFSPDVVGLLAVGPVARMQGTGALTFYTCPVVSTGGGAPVVILYKFVAGVQTQLGDPVPVTVSLPYPLTLRVEGDQLQVRGNGALLLDETDPAIPTGRYAGLQGVASGLNLARVTTLQAAVAAPTTFHPAWAGRSTVTLYAGRAA